MHVAVQKPKVVKVAIGPIDAGNSTGIVMLQKYWRQQGHVIVDVNLKGVSHHTTGNCISYFLVFSVVIFFIILLAIFLLHFPYVLMKSYSPLIQTWRRVFNLLFKLHMKCWVC